MSYDKSTQPLYKGNKINQTLKKAGKWTNQNVDKKMITEKKKIILKEMLGKTT